MITRSNAGSGILATMITIFAVAALLGVIFSVTMTINRNSDRSVDRAQAIAFGQGVVESYFDQWRDQMNRATAVADRRGGLSTATLTANIAVPPSADAPLGITLVAPGAPVRAVDPSFAATTRADGRPIPEDGTPALTRTRLNYVGTATVQFPGAAPNNQVTVSRVFIRGGRTMFDYFFFGLQPRIEFHPGAPMFPDDIYAGGDMYTAHNHLHLRGDTTYTGKHVIGYSPDDPRVAVGMGDVLTASHVNIDNDGYADNWANAPHEGPEEKIFDSSKNALDPIYTDADQFNETTFDLKPKDSDGNPNNDGYHELIEKYADGPLPGEDLDPLLIEKSETTGEPDKNHRLASNADYRIEIDSGDNLRIFEGQKTSALAPGDAQYDAIFGALELNKGFKDNREADFVRAVDINVGKLTTAHAEGKLKDTVFNTKPDGLTLYFEDATQGLSKSTLLPKQAGGNVPVLSSRTRAFRLVKGAKLPSVGLTVASSNAIYIQGDYNTGRDLAAIPAKITPSNVPATAYPNPTSNPDTWVSGYDRVPAAVVGDAVNILSNAWTDALSDSGKSYRIPEHTTINAAILAGNVPSHRGSQMIGPGGTASTPAYASESYSGGVENFVRLHESWGSGNYLSIRGTLALLFSSQQARGNWLAASYDAPNRRWAYEPLFQTKNPPGFHSGRNFTRGQWLTAQ